MSNNIENLIINCIRTLSMDAVQRANSGHPGTPMALAPVAFKLWDKFMKYNPGNPDWPNRDRFVLSAGHASMLLYSLLHITGFDITMEDIKTFRRLHSRCAGHPEYGLAPGVETTTGPLGQGASTAVGMAIAEKWLSSYFNKPGHDIINYNVFSILSDGDIMEGITSEAASLAGHLGLDNLVWIYDSNDITIEGSTELSFSENVALRFEGYNWHTDFVEDANDLNALESAIEKAVNNTGSPSIIIMRSHIAFGSPNKQDTHGAHGAPLGDEEIRLTKEFYGWDPDKTFYVPDEVKNYREEIIARGRSREEEWNRNFEEYRKQYPELAMQFEAMQKGEYPGNPKDHLPVFEPDPKGTATRSANGKILNSIAKNIPWFMGGAGDVGSSTKTYIDSADSFLKNSYSGRNFHFGIRENAMAAITNGMALSKLRPYNSTYFVFSDYMKAPLRLSSLMKLPVVHIFTHDSIGVGEDGPTHQPVEHLAALRAVPNLDVIRPADANELSVLWKHILNQNNKPSALILTRQNVPVIDREKYSSADGAMRGGYVIADCDGEPEIILVSTGSEVHICLDVHEKLISNNIKSRVVSMPCWSIFDSQPEDYKQSVLPDRVKTRMSVEAGATLGWERYIIPGNSSKIYGIDRFGESAPCNDVMKEFGFTPENIYKQAIALIPR